MLAFVCEGYFAVDQAVQFRDEVETGYQKSGELRVFFSLQGTEEVIEVGHYFFATGEKTAIGVKGGGFFVKVAGADVGVAGDFLTV